MSKASLEDADRDACRGERAQIFLAKEEEKIPFRVFPLSTCNAIHILVVKTITLT